MSNDLMYEKKGAIAYITFNRPAKMNAITSEMYSILESSVYDYTNDDNLRCLIITGAGGNFSSGADLKERTKIKETQGNQTNDGWGMFPAYRAIDLCPKPVIAAIDGYCLASGFNCATLYCDFRISSERAKFGIPATKRGLSLPYSSPWTWNMTLGNALYMVLTGKILTADEALRMGITSEVVPHEKLMERATELATIIAESAPLHIQCHKEYVRRFMEVPGSFGQRLIEMTMRPLRHAADSDEGKKAFVEKRKPEFHGK